MKGVDHNCCIVPTPPPPSLRNTRSEMMGEKGLGFDGLITGAPADYCVVSDVIVPHSEVLVRAHSRVCVIQLLRRCVFYLHYA